METATTAAPKTAGIAFVVTELAFAVDEQTSDASHSGRPYSPPTIRHSIYADARMATESAIVQAATFTASTGIELEYRPSAGDSVEAAWFVAPYIPNTWPVVAIYREPVNACEWGDWLMSDIEIYLRIDGENFTLVSEPDDLAGYLDYFARDVEAATRVEFVAVTKLELGGEKIRRESVLAVVKGGEGK